MKSTQAKPSWDQRWNNYWFQNKPLFNLAVFRIIVIAFQIGYLLTKNSLQKIYEHAIFPDSLYSPIPVLKFFILPFGLDYRPPFIALTVIYWLTLITGFGSLIGFKTRVNLILFALGNWFIQAYIYSYNDFHHPEALMMIALVPLACSPAGAVLSVDDLLNRLKQNLKNQQFTEVKILKENSYFAFWPLLLMQWIYALIYLSAALSKLTYGPDLIHFDWANGYTLQSYLIQDGIRWNRDFGVWFGQQHTLAWLSSWMSLIFEATFFFVLIVPKLAWFYVPLGISFHVGIYLAQKAPFFQYIAIYSVFISWTAIIAFFSRSSAAKHEKQQPEIFYDGLCPLCIRSMTVLSYFDWFNRLKYSDLEQRWQYLQQKHPQVSFDDCLAEMHLLLPNNSVKKGFFAFRAILWHIPALWPFLLLCYFPGAAIIGPKVYKFVASRRKRLTRCTFDSCSIGAQK